ncbi:MAG: hypothetical protein H7325_05595, partial [Pedobacter sp.]|nr:hypothetical protein [Pedobacter sp.]
MNLSSLKYELVLNLKNIPGPTVSKKIVVIECDDYGSIRMPSVDILHQLQAGGIPVDASRYNLLDTLEDKDDLEQLFETLSSIKDHNGNAAVIS